MPTQTSKAQQPDTGAALILGGVLGLLLASAAAVAVGGWQYWKSTVTVVPTVSVPATQAAPVGYPARGQAYGGTNPYVGTSASAYGDATGAAPNPQPATFQLAPQPVVPAPTNSSLALPPASPENPTLVSPAAWNSVELPVDDKPIDSEGE